MFKDEYGGTARVRILELKIKNWKKHNPRADVKTCSWFKMSNDFFSDPDFYMVSGDGQRLWIYLLSMASKKMTDTIRVNTQMAANALRVSLESIDFAVLELMRTGSLLEMRDYNSSEELASERKENVTNFLRPLEENREEEIREENRRIDERTPKKNLSKKDSQEILSSPDNVVQLFNDTLARKVGRIEYCSGLGHNQIKDLRDTFSFKQFMTLDGWRVVFDKIKSSAFYNGTQKGSNFVVTMNWLCKSDNAFKILNSSPDQDFEARGPSQRRGGLTPEKIERLKAAGEL